MPTRFMYMYTRFRFMSALAKTVCTPWVLLECMNSSRYYVNADTGYMNSAAGDPLQFKYRKKSLICERLVGVSISFSASCITVTQANRPEPTRLSRCDIRAGRVGGSETASHMVMWRASTLYQTRGRVRRFSFNKYAQWKSLRPHYFPSVSSWNRCCVNASYFGAHLFWLTGRSRQWTVDRYASAGKHFCDLDLWTAVTLKK